MKAIVVRGLGEVAVETVEDARIEAPTDVLLRVTSAAMCGTDLHIYEGRMGDVRGMVIGHEPLGVVEDVGSAVVSVKKGDRVTVPTHVCCGFCVNCVRGYTDACLMTNPGAAGAAYGYPGMGGYRGTDTELVRVPFADANCLRLPGEPGDDWEHDFVLLADAFPPGYHATELAQVSPGDSVAIFGAGAIGFQARAFNDPDREDPAVVIHALAQLVNPTGRLGIAGVFLPQDARPNDELEDEVTWPFPGLPCSARTSRSAWAATTTSATTRNYAT